MTVHMRMITRTYLSSHSKRNDSRQFTVNRNNKITFQFTLDSLEFACTSRIYHTQIVEFTLEKKYFSSYLTTTRKQYFSKHLTHETFQFTLVKEKT